MYYIFILVLGTLTAFGPICTDLYLPALPTITLAFNSNASLMGLTLTASFLGLALGQIIIGPISDAIGRKKPLLISLVVFVIASLLCASTNNLVLFIIYRFFQGLSGSGGLVLSRAIACDLYKGTKLSAFMSLLMVINSVAPIIGPILGSLIITFLAWHYIFIVLALLGLILLILSTFTIKESLSLKDRKDTLLKSIKSMLQELVNLKFLYMVLSMGSIMAGFFAYLAASPFIIQKIYNMSPLAYSVIFSINAISIAITAQLASRLSPKIGDRKILYIAYVILFIVSIVMLFIAFINPTNPLFAIITILISVSMVGLTQGPGFALSMEAKKGGFGSASGIFGVVIFIFAAFSSSLSSLEGDMSMRPLAFIMLLGVILSFILFYLSLKRKA